MFLQKSGSRCPSINERIAQFESELLSLIIEKQRIDRNIEHLKILIQEMKELSQDE